MSDGGQTDLGGNGGIVFGGNERLLRLGRPLVPESAGTARLSALLLAGSDVLRAYAAMLPDRRSTGTRGDAGVASTSTSLRRA